MLLLKPPGSMWKPTARKSHNATEQQRAVLTLNRFDFIRLHQDTRGVHAGIIVCTRDDADSATFAQRIHFALSNHGNLAGQLIRIVKPSV